MWVHTGIWARVTPHSLPSFPPVLHKCNRPCPSLALSPLIPLQLFPHFPTHLPAEEPALCQKVCFTEENLFVLHACCCGSPAHLKLGVPLRSPNERSHCTSTSLPGPNQPPCCDFQWEKFTLSHSGWVCRSEFRLTYQKCYFRVKRVLRSLADQKRGRLRLFQSLYLRFCVLDSSIT